MKRHNDFSDIIIGFSCFKSTFKLQVTEGSCTYEAPPRKIAYVLQELLQEGLERLQKEHIIVHPDVAETYEGCNSLMLVPKENGKVTLCLDLAWLNKVLIWPIHRGPTLNDTYDCHFV